MNKASKNDINQGITDDNQVLAWETIDWKTSNSAVSKLQRYLFKASKSGDIKKVRNLQHLLLNSRSAKLLAIRRVTQENLGKRTKTSWYKL